jgi:ribonuclease HII
MSRALTVGVDENGLGPMLGPMVVTGVLVSLAHGDAAREASTAAGVGDSKALCAHGAMAEVEGLVLAVLDAHLGLRPTSYRELQSALGLQTETVLRALCPAGEAPRMCFGAEVALPAFGGGVTSRSRAAAEALRRDGLTLRAARQGYACARALNVAKSQGRSRFDVDLAMMLDLVAVLRAEAGADLVAVCGKVGGRKSYGAALGARWALARPMEERSALSSYQVPGVGELRFAQDADATEPAVSLASLVGKYARELAMLRIHRYFEAAMPGLNPVSGYHDPVTARFVEATRLLRREVGVEDGCFAR